MTPAAGFSDVLGPGAGDLAHGVVEGQTEDLNAEVNGVAGEVALGPAPIAVLDDEARISGQNEIARILCDDLNPALLEQRREGCQPGGADLLARPADGNDVLGRTLAQPVARVKNTENGVKTADLVPAGMPANLIW
jgi:hypothetical protein